MIPAYSISKAAGSNLTQSLRSLLKSQGVTVHGVFLGPIDTDMNRGLEIPKAPPAAAAQGIFDGLEKGEEDIFPDPASFPAAEGWRAGIAKRMGFLYQQQPEQLDHDRKATEQEGTLTKPPITARWSGFRIQKISPPPMNSRSLPGFTIEGRIGGAPPKQQEDNMHSLASKTMVVIGGSRGVGRQIVEAGIRNSARVLAVARDEGRLARVAREVPGTETLSLDATDEAAPAKVFGVLKPDILVVAAGAFPPTAPLHKQNWHEFAVNWESDVKIAFHFVKAALSTPLSAGSTIVLISSGAALAGSPNSGGYAGAKRTQIFMANYSQKESDRLGLDLKFLVLAPRMMPDTELGKHAVAGYSHYLGISASDFIKSMATPPTSSDVAAGVIELVTRPNRPKESVFIVTGKGLEAVAA